jgi:deoxycytidylate deaminase
MSALIGRDITQQESDDRFWLQLAADEANKSPDPSTKNGAVMVCRPRTAAEPPRYCKDCNRFSTIRESALKADPTILQPLTASRDLRLAWIEHAERNALFTAVRHGYQTSGGTLYCPFAACTDCARAIVLLGIERLVRLGPESFEGYPERWRGSIKIADDIMLAAGVKVDTYRGPLLDREYWLDGKPWRV